MRTVTGKNNHRAQWMRQATDSKKGSRTANPKIHYLPIINRPMTTDPNKRRSKAKNLKKAQRDRERYLKRKAAREAVAGGPTEEISVAGGPTEVKFAEAVETVVEYSGLKEATDAIARSESEIGRLNREIATLKASKAEVEKTVERMESELRDAHSRNSHLVGSLDASREKSAKLARDIDNLRKEVVAISQRSEARAWLSAAGWTAFALLSVATMFF